MIPVSTSLDFCLAHPDLEIEKLEPGEDSYIGIEGRFVHHSCEKMASDPWEAGFCNGGLYYLSARYTEDRMRQYLGWTYSCKRHLRLVALEFSLTLENKSLDIEYSEWTDAQVAAERQA